MNYILLATDIVRRVQHSPDSAHNLAETVENLIQEEIDRDTDLSRDARLAILYTDARRIKLAHDYSKDFR